MLGRIKPAVLVVLIWTAAGLFQAVPDTFQHFYWPASAAKLIESWSWALLTPAVLLIDRKLTSIEQNLVRLSLYHLLLSLPISLVHTALCSLLEYPIDGISWSPMREPGNTRYYFLGSWMVYCAFAGIIQAFKFNNRFLSSQFKLERAEKKLAQSRLNALRLQLEPHFLFNTLNGISTEVMENPELACEMIEDLSILLRRSIDCHETVEITLAQELTLLNHYLAIQRLRFGEKIDIRVDVEPAVEAAMVPSMLLQPLIENAIQHGLRGSKSGGTVAISARHMRERYLEIKVVDDGVGLPPHWSMDASGGLGLRVTRERLEALYSESAEDKFTVSPRKGGGTDVTIRIPLHWVEGETDETTR